MCLSSGFLFLAVFFDFSYFDWKKYFNMVCVNLRLDAKNMIIHKF